MHGHVMRWMPTLTPRRLRQLWYAPLLVAWSGGPPAAKLLAAAPWVVARGNPGDTAGSTPFRVDVPYGESSVWTQPFTTAP